MQAMNNNNNNDIHEQVIALHRQTDTRNRDGIRADIEKLRTLAGPLEAKKERVFMAGLGWQAIGGRRPGFSCFPSFFRRNREIDPYEEANNEAYGFYRQHIKEYRKLKTEFDALYNKLSKTLFYWFLQSTENNESVFVTVDVKKNCELTSPRLYNICFDAVSVDHLLQLEPYVIVDTYEEAIKIDEGARKRVEERKKQDKELREL